MNPEYAYLRFSVLIGLNITAIPFCLALYQALKLLNYINSENGFSERSVISLKQIKNYAMIIIILYVMGMIFLISQNALHPGITIICFVIIFAAVLQELLRSSLEIKGENDLTI
ncbi:DUF2975 domain-containing protein [Lysinibacillus sp. NPDC097287]|uniref:DUF2975 domain-containing protein n=1 Tax=Lysinibacillus sp. NPDC097287 TaxID=3364144 RepID=UPI00380344E1